MAEPLVTIVGFCIENRELSCSPDLICNSKPVVRQRSMLSEMLAQASSTGSRTPSEQSCDEQTSSDDDWSEEGSDDEQDSISTSESTSSEDDEELNVTRPIDIPVPKDKHKKAVFFRNMKLKMEMRRNDHTRQRAVNRAYYA